MEIEIGDKIVILGDIHYPDRVDTIDQKLIDTITSLGIEKYIFTGDLTEYEVIDRFNPEQYLVVQGNMDQFRTIKIACIDIEHYRLVITHGDIVKPRGDLNIIRSLLEKWNGDIFISGHTHIPMLQRIEDKIVFNPGSFSFTATFGVIEFRMKEIFIELRHREKIETQIRIPF